MCNSLWPRNCSTSGFPCPSLSPGICSNSVHWVNDGIQPSHPLLPPSPPALNLPASGSFPMSWLFQSGGQMISTSASASVLPMNIQSWFPLGLTGLVSLLTKRLLSIFTSITILKHQFFSAQSSLWSNSHIVHDYCRNHSFDYTELCQKSDVSDF